MSRRPRPPRSCTDRRISRLGIHRFQPKVSPRPQRSLASSQSYRTPSAWSIPSGASTQRFTPLNLLHLPRIHDLLVHPLKNVQENEKAGRSLRKTLPFPETSSRTTSCIHSQASNSSKVKPASRRLFCSKPLRLLSSSERGTIVHGVVEGPPEQPCSRFPP